MLIFIEIEQSSECFASVLLDIKNYHWLMIISILQRQHRNALRYADDQASRTQPPPDLPGGPFHKTSKIYYFSRDARREVEPPMVIASANVKQITDG